MEKYKKTKQNWGVTEDYKNFKDMLQTENECLKQYGRFQRIYFVLWYHNYQ
jgi:hypothetical protein